MLYKTRPRRQQGPARVNRKTPHGLTGQEESSVLQHDLKSTQESVFAGEGEVTAAVDL